MGVLDLFIVALMPVLKVLLVTAVGSFLAMDRVNLLGHNAKQHMNNTNSPFGDSSTCSTYGEAYASLSMAPLSSWLSNHLNFHFQICTMYLWTYVYTLMRMSAEKRAEETDPKDATASLNADGATSIGLPEIITEPLLAPENSPSPKDCISQDEIYQMTFNGKTKTSFLKKIWQYMTTITEHIDIKKLFAPSTIAVIIGFIIGVASPIRKLIIGDDAPLRVIYTATDLLGEAAVPCITLIIGANLLRVIIGVITIRYIALPLIGIGVIKAAHHYGMVGSDALYQFTLMLQYAVPPAMNVGTITLLLEAGESECSIIMLWTYAVASLSLTFWSTFFMWIVS
ncbi:hypothetical protein BT93_I1685 [Corymbia citriodora subsp. variegata]|nr:hypothetical protein BT93_I1685 [Corymbia citriodora subsp. variegata]